MKKLQLLIAFCAAIILSACAGLKPTAGESKTKLLETGVHHQRVINADYVTVYSKLKPYYQRCIAKKGVSYPITAGGATITQRTPDTYISTKLDRQNNSAMIDTWTGSLVTQHIKITPVNKTTTKLNITFMKKGALQTQSGYTQKLNRALEHIVQVSQSRYLPDCL